VTSFSSDEPQAGVARQLSIVIPAFNEEGAIGPILQRVLSTRDRLAEEGLKELEVIVVDDGSHDRTAEIARGVPAVRVIQLSENGGYGAALKRGFSEARGDFLGFLDADGTYPPESLPDLCRIALAGADMVVGCRMNAQSNGMPISRRIGNRLFAGLVTVLGNGRVVDCASGMRVLRRRALNDLYPLPDGLHFTPVMSLRAMHEGLSVTEVPIPYAERIGESKLRVSRDGLRYLRSIVWTALSYDPVRVLGGAGLIGFALAAVIGVCLLIARLSGVTTLGPAGVTAVFVALVSAVGGLSLFNLGATFNYLLSMVRRKPVRRSIFRTPLFAEPLEHRFGWIGALVAFAGLTLAILALSLGADGWPIERLWLHLVVSALLILVGVQLVLSWMLMKALEQVAQREAARARNIDA